MKDLVTLSEKELKLAKLQELERRKLLPHLYGFKFYKWSREFFEDTSRIQLLNAGNQLGKSTLMIRKCLHWATEPSLWPKLWSTEPTLFIYGYPSYDLATTEVETKWIPTLLPKGAMKDDPKYGWKLMYKPNKMVDHIQFNSGVRLLFISYEKSVHSLQGMSVDAMFIDEELNSEMFPELSFRLVAKNGYFCSVFTATKGQEFWAEAMEPHHIGSKRERFQGAYKRQISLFDCKIFEDGTPSHFSDERIEQIVSLCQSENEVLKRVHGRFVRDDSRRFVFSKNKNYITPLPEDWKETPPEAWHVFAGVDVGSGLPGGAPSAIYFIAIRPDFRFGRIYKGWRGDGVQTTAGDVYNKYMEMKDKQPLMASYDWGSSDFGTIAANNSEPFAKAIKDRERGIEIMNTLFRFGMLVVDDIGDEHLEKLANELSNLGVDSISGDDAADSLRYGLMPIPWDFTGIKKDLKVEKPIEDMSQLEQRRGGHVSDLLPAPSDSVESELSEWSDMYD